MASSSWVGVGVSIAGDQMSDSGQIALGVGWLDRAVLVELLVKVRLGSGRFHGLE